MYPSTNRQGLFPSRGAGADGGGPRQVREGEGGDGAAGAHGERQETALPPAQVLGDRGAEVVEVSETRRRTRGERSKGGREMGWG